MKLARTIQVNAIGAALLSAVPSVEALSWSARVLRLSLRSGFGSCRGWRAAARPVTSSRCLGSTASRTTQPCTRRWMALVIRDCGVPTPNFRVMRRGTENTGDLQLRVVVKPRRGSGSLGLQLVHEPTRLNLAVEVVVAQDRLMEECIKGQELYIALLGNEELEVLPLVEHGFGDREKRPITWEDKNHMAVPVPQKICPAQVGSKLTTMVRNISIATYHACLCRDHARVDLRIDLSGQPFVLEVNTFPSPNMDLSSSHVLAATTAGYSLSSLVNRILDIAHTRYFGIGIPQGRIRV